MLISEQLLGRLSVLLQDLWHASLADGSLYNVASKTWRRIALCKPFLHDQSTFFSSFKAVRPIRNLWTLILLKQWLGHLMRIILWCVVAISSVVGRVQIHDWLASTMRAQTALALDFPILVLPTPRIARWLTGFLSNLILRTATWPLHTNRTLEGINIDLLCLLVGRNWLLLLC